MHKIKTTLKKLNYFWKRSQVPTQELIQISTVDKLISEADTDQDQNMMLADVSASDINRLLGTNLYGKQKYDPKIVGGRSAEVQKYCHKIVKYHIFVPRRENAYIRNGIWLLLEAKNAKNEFWT